MARAPEAGPDIDLTAQPSIADLQPARASLLGRVDGRQHAVMTEWGWPPLSTSFDLDAGDSGKVPVRIPPGVEYFALSMLVEGNGRVDITSTNTGLTIRLSWGEALQIDGYGLEVITLGPDGSLTGALQVRSGSTWAWDDDEIEFDSTKTDGTLGFDGKIKQVTFWPIHEVV